jgi:hypothetical protein
VSPLLGLPISLFLLTLHIALQIHLMIDLLCSYFYDFFTEELWLNQNEFEGDIGLLTDALPKRLVSLDMDTNLLTGTIPPSIGTLTDLDFLDFGDNNLSGKIPIELGLLTKLTMLSLRANQMTGTIPSELGLLTKLTVLVLSVNQLTGTVPTSLASLPLLSKSTQSLFLFPFATVVFHVCTLFHTGLYLDGNDLSGSLDAFCSMNFTSFAANTCGHDEMNCTCCNICCDLDGSCKFIEQ